MRFAWLRTKETRDALEPTPSERLTLVAYNVAWWVPVVMPLLGVISYHVGFVAFLGVTVVRALINGYRINVLPVAAAERLPLRSRSRPGTTCSPLISRTAASSRPERDRHRRNRSVRENVRWSPLPAPDNGARSQSRQVARRPSTSCLVDCGQRTDRKTPDLNRTPEQAATSRTYRRWSNRFAPKPISTTGGFTAAQNVPGRPRSC